MQDSPSMPPDRDPQHPDGGSSTGLDSRLASALCYLAGVVSAVLFLVLEREDRLVRFHAYQSLGTFGVLIVLSVGAGLIPFFGGLIQLVVTPLSLILWIVLMVKAYQGGERFRLPWIGDWAEEQASI